MTLTLPTYIGSLNLWEAVPEVRVNGPANLTIGLNLLSFLLFIARVSSPPMLNIGENLPQ